MIYRRLADGLVTEDHTVLMIYRRLADLTVL